MMIKKRSGGARSRSPRKLPNAEPAIIHLATPIVAYQTQILFTP